MWKEIENKYGVKKGLYALVLKRVIDFLFTLVGFVVISPLFLVLCVLVRCQLGSPIFFKQKRTGKDEKTFEMIKFRTMTDARDLDGNLLPDTERFTKFGDFMRRSSLDELPELLNVLKGDMSLVGPRPLYPFYVPYYTEKESLRHSVRGGITGLAQVNGRALCKWDDRFTYDVEYVKNITFFGDIKVLIMTVKKVLGKADIGVPSVTEEGGLHIIREVQRPETIKNIEDDPNMPKFVQGVE
ncbi:MAG: sugar transferase [Lachnospiraceae bacterium]|nr:sugar transferase [Lachnospiraceae bacterium]